MRLRCLFLLTGAAMAGCAPTVHLPAADTQLPQSFEAPAAQADKGAVALDHWWTDFNDPQLTSLVTTALERSTTARLAFARIAEARAVRLQSRASTLPTGNLTGSVTKQGVEQLWGGGDGSAAAALLGTAPYQASFTPSWEIDLFGRLAAIRDKADLDYRASALDFYGARLALAGDVAAALFQSRYLAVQLDTANEALHIARDLARSADIGRDRGLISGQDAARLEADVSSGEAEATRLEAELRAAKRSLLILTGQPTAPTDSLAIAAALAPPPALPEATPGLLLARRPDVRGAELSLESAARTVQIDRLALFPRFSIQPGAVLSGASAAGIGLWSIAGSVALPVLDRARLLATLRISEARGQQAVISYEQAVQNAFGDAENALTRVDAGRRRIDQLVLATDRARYAFDAARRGYSAGLTDLTTLLQAERVWLQNRTALDGARFGLLSDTVTAIRALGGGWNPQADLSPAAPLPSSTEAP